MRPFPQTNLTHNPAHAMMMMIFLIYALIVCQIDSICESHSRSGSCHDGRQISKRDLFGTQRASSPLVAGKPLLLARRRRKVVSTVVIPPLSGLVVHNWHNLHIFAETTGIALGPRPY